MTSKPKSVARIEGERRARAWTVAYWARVKADPKLYEEHCNKVKEAFLKRRLKGIFFVPRKSKRLEN